MLTMDEGMGAAKPKPKAALPAAMPASPMGGGITPVAKPTPFGAPKPELPGTMPGGMPNAAPTAMPAAVPAAGGILTSGAGDGFGSSAPSAPAPTPAPPPAAGGSPVALTPTNPDNPLTSQTIGAGQLADRFALAQQKYDQFVQSTDPSYQAALRDAKRAGAAAGGLGSGQLRTSIGDLAGQRANAMDVQRQGAFTDAMGGSIDDAWKSIGLAERQQGFQNTQQQQAFANELRRMGFDDDLLNSEVGRALQVYMAGQTGGTGSGTAMQGAQGIGNQGQDAMDALMQLIRGRAAAPTGAPRAPTPAPEPYPWAGPGGMNG